MKAQWLGTLLAVTCVWLAGNFLLARNAAAQPGPPPMRMEDGRGGPPGPGGPPDEMGGPGGMGGLDGMGPPPGGPDPLAQHFFRPEMVMRMQDKLHLSDDQKDQIKKAIKEAQSRSIDIRWSVDEQKGKLEKIISQDKVDEKAAMEQARKLMALEQQMKETQLQLLIRVRNALTAEQQEQLRTLREERMGMRDRRGGQRRERQR